MVTTTRSVATTTHGRVVIEEAGDGRARPLLVLCHGYAQRAEDMIESARQIPGIDRWTLVAPQALHRFYSRGSRSAPTPERVVASWMTREDRELAIADNVAYVDRVIDDVATADVPIVFFGFSQGASMAYRAAVLGRHRAAGVIALAGDIPPELRLRAGEVESLEERSAARHIQKWPPVLIGAGAADPWFTEARVSEEAAWLTSHGIEHEVCRFEGGHEWTAAFGAAVSEFLERILP